MATPVIGTLHEFNPDVDTITTFLESVDLYFSANAVANAKRVPALLTTIGSTTYTLLSNLLAPEAPKDKSLADITAALTRHFEPTRSVIAERFHFHRRNQTATETIAEYLAALRQAALHCSFDAFLEEALRDRLVGGLRTEAVQKRLLSEADLTLTNAVKIAQGMESADRNTRSLKDAAPVIHQLTSSIGGRKPPCSRCGKTTHTPSDCRFKEAECHACGKKGHIAPVCRSKPQPQNRRYPKKFQNTYSTNMVQEDQRQNDSDPEEFYLYKFKETRPSPMQIPLQVEGKPLTMELDTGAAVSIISEDTRRTMFPQLKLRKSNIVLRTYTDESLQVTGQLHVHVQYGNQTQPLVLVVVAGNGPSLFGRNWLKYLQMDWSRIGTITKPSEGLEVLLKKHDQLFRHELGTVRPQKATLHVKPDVAPKFFKPRLVPFAVKDAVGQELDRLENQGIIRKVNTSDWAAPIVAVPKKDRRFRLCGDYKVTINQALTVDQYPLPKPEHLFATLANGTVFTKLDLSQAYLQLQLDEASLPYVTVNTHQGLYQYTRLPFGVASAPAIFNA